MCACTLARSEAAAALTFADERDVGTLIRLIWEQFSAAATYRTSHSCSGSLGTRKEMGFGTERVRKMRENVGIGRNRTTQPRERSGLVF